MTEKNRKEKKIIKSERNHSLSIKDGMNEQEILGDFIIGENLGKGTFGKVKLGVHKITGEKVTK